MTMEVRRWLRGADGAGRRAWTVTCMGQPLREQCRRAAARGGRAPGRQFRLLHQLAAAGRRSRERGMARSVEGDGLGGGRRGRRGRACAAFDTRKRMRGRGRRGALSGAPDRGAPLGRTAAVARRVLKRGGGARAAGHSDHKSELAHLRTERYRASSFISSRHPSNDGGRPARPSR